MSPFTTSNMETSVITSNVRLKIVDFQARYHSLPKSKANFIHYFSFFTGLTMMLKKMYWLFQWNKTPNWYRKDYNHFNQFKSLYSDSFFTFTVWWTYFPIWLHTLKINNFMTNIWRNNWRFHIWRHRKTPLMRSNDVIERLC